MSDQLFDAGGPVRPGKRTGHRASSLVCKFPGCNQPRLYRHRYCAEHATLINYKMTTGPKGPGIERDCQSCGRPFVHRSQIVTDRSDAWHMFCTDCHYRTSLTLRQLTRHNVPVDLMVTWLRLGTDLCCDVCSRRFTNHLTPAIDHNHRCCNGRYSTCGQCIRGLLCPSCNNVVGQLESRLDDAGRARLAAYLEKGITGSGEG